MLVFQLNFYPSLTRSVELRKYYSEVKSMTMHSLGMEGVHPSWKECIQQGLSAVDPAYLKELSDSTEWLPGHEKIFNAFSIPLNKVNYVLFGESPYPRAESANGYAFWDASVKELWSPQGLSKKVNRATSLRNIMKMLLIAENLLDQQHPSQDKIAQLNKENLIQTNDELFQNLIDHGFLLLNATPVLQATGAPQKDAKAWFPFMKGLLNCLLAKRPEVEFILLGNIANKIDKLIDQPHLKKLYAEHPYNISFISNPKIIEFFKPLHLLRNK